MNTPDDEPEDEMTEAYRRTSEAEAGAPASSTRAAILAEARAAALRRTPAANQSLYAWRAVAGIAVIGVAVLLWRQADRSVTTDLTVKTTAPTVPELGPVTPEPVAAQPQANAKVAGVLAESTAKVEEESRAASDVRERDETPAVAKVSPATPAPSALEARADAAPATATGALRQATTDYQGMLQREFPEVWSAATPPPRTVWLVVDATGKVVNKGVLSDANAASVSGQPPGVRTVGQVKTASGSSLQLAVIQVN